MFYNIFGNRYDYSETEFIAYRKPIRVRCRNHGYYNIEISNHLRGSGCPKCAKISRARKIIKKCANEFVGKARNAHGNKYDYSLIKYINAKTPVDIICLIHGIFQQPPCDHLSGYGCKRCALEHTAQLKKDKAAEEFPMKANIIHNNKYDYSKVIWKGSNENIEIICPIHGSFYQSPSNHLSGCGCPKCNQSQGEKKLITLFNNNSIIYEYQKRFQWMGYQSYDFYFPNLNIALEYQGGQHFYPVKRFGGEEYLKIQQQRDLKKLKLSKEHNIQLIYYCDKKYVDFYKESGSIVFTNEEDLIKFITEYNKQEQC